MSTTASRFIGMSVIGFAQQEDTVELVKALGDEGYRCELNAGDAGGDVPWILTVEPFDERVVEMVDVYGGWIPGDTQLAE